MRKEHIKIMGDTHPKPPRKVFDFAISEFAGMLCPICEKTPLSLSNQFPLCRSCQEKYFSEDAIAAAMLNELQGYNFMLDQEVNWRKKPLYLKGKISGKTWRARFLGEDGWFIHRSADKEEEKLSDLEAQIITKTLESLTPNFQDRILQAQTHFRKRILYAALGGTILTAGTIAYIVGKKKKEKEDEL